MDYFFAAVGAIILLVFISFALGAVLALLFGSFKTGWLSVMTHLYGDKKDAK